MPASQATMIYFLMMDEFKKKRILGRKIILDRIIESFRNDDSIAIHQFGSGTGGFRDEFSDIDIWVTIKDDRIKETVGNLSKIFNGIAPVLVRHHSKSWSPVGGSASSVIHENEYGLFVVDYYISKLSETVLKQDAKVVYGVDDLQRGEWKLNRHVDKKIHDNHTIKKDLDLLIDLVFISIKKIVRNETNDGFVVTLRTVHKNFREKYGKLKPRRISITVRSYLRLLSDFYLISNKRQRRAINKIKKLIREVVTVYNIKQ